MWHPPEELVKIGLRYSFLPGKGRKIGQSGELSCDWYDYKALVISYRIIWVHLHSAGDGALGRKILFPPRGTAGSRLVYSGIPVEIPEWDHERGHDSLRQKKNKIKRI